MEQNEARRSIEVSHNEGNYIRILSENPVRDKVVLQLEQ